MHNSFFIACLALLKPTNKMETKIKIKDLTITHNNGLYTFFINGEMVIFNINDILKLSEFIYSSKSKK